MPFADEIVQNNAAYVKRFGNKIRNAGGRFAPDAVRSLVISQTLLGTREVVVVHHTGCGMLTFTSDDAKGLVRKREGITAEGIKEVDRLDFCEFADLEQSVKDDVDAIRAHPLLLGETVVSGWVYEVETGKVRRVV
ncbi:hypothetical protein JCM3770_005575 [Rhodotorula araucariae]